MTTTASSAAEPGHARGRLRRQERHPALRRCHLAERRLAADGPRRDPRRDRAQRRRQDLAVQLPHRRLHAAGGLDRPRRPLGRHRHVGAGPQDPRHQQAWGSPARSRTSASSPPSPPWRTSRSAWRPGRSPARSPPMLGLPVAASRGAGVHREGLRAAALRRADPTGQRARRLAGLRRAAAPGDRPGPRHRARRDPPRRAGRRHQPGREAGAGRADPQDQRGRHLGAAHRARHEAGDVGRRPAGGAQLRREDRRGHARADPEATRPSSRPTSAPRRTRPPR